LLDPKLNAINPTPDDPARYRPTILNLVPSLLHPLSVLLSVGLRGCAETLTLFGVLVVFHEGRCC